MKIIDAGYFIGDVNERIAFWSHQHFLDHNMLCVRLSTLIRELEDVVGYRRGEKISQFQINSMIEWIKKKKSEISEFYALGGVVLIIVDTVPLTAYKKNIHPPGQLYYLDLLQIFSDETITFQYTRCEGSTLTSDPSIRELLSKGGSRYHFTLEASVEIKVLATLSRHIKYSLS
jgi:hypothetical protein